MPLRVLGPDQYRRMPWKNGLGVTAEVARFPEAGDAFDWRISIASVERDGPFSPLPGLDRILLVLDGPGLVLERGAGCTTLAPFEPFAFSGDDPIVGRLVAGPIRDFNVMTRRGVARARLDVLRDRAAALATPANGHALVYCHAGSVTVVSSDGAATLAAGATVVVDRPASVLRVELVPGSTVLAVILDGPQPG